jgi:hypothetical protein
MVPYLFQKNGAILAFKETNTCELICFLLGPFSLFLRRRSNIFVGSEIVAFRVSALQH